MSAAHSNASLAMLLSSVALAAVLGAGCTGVATNDHAGAQDGGVAAMTDCKSCHMAEYRRVRKPVHVGAKPTECGVCHSQDSWHPEELHHDWWPITGDHLKAECKFCHEGTPPVFRGTPKECIGCHREDFEKSKFPGHSGFPRTCNDCHSTSAWKPATHKPAPEPLPALAAIDAGAQAPKASPATHPKPRPTSAAAPTTSPTAVPTTTPTTRPTSTPAPDVTTKASRHR